MPYIGLLYLIIMSFIICNLKLLSTKMFTYKPQFLHSSHAIEVEVCMLHLVGSFREANVSCYMDSPSPHPMGIELIWCTLWTMDVSTHKGVCRDICLGDFFTHKTISRFSTTALDQSNEQISTLVKEVVLLHWQTILLLFVIGWWQAPNCQEWLTNLNGILLHTN